MRILFTILIVIFTTACGPRLTPLPISAQTSSPANVVPSVLTPDNREEKMVALAIDDLVSRFTLDGQQIRVVSVQPARWPDAALGCPRPGAASAEQAEPGYLIVLEANGQEYIYRTDVDRMVILCLEKLPSFPVTPGEIDDGEPWMPVD